MRYDTYEIDALECPTDLKPTGTVKGEVEDAEKVIAELSALENGRALRSLQEFLEAAECNDGLKGIVEVLDPAVAEDQPTGSFSAELETKTIFRDLVEDQKTALCKTDPCISYDLDKELTDKEIRDSFGELEKPGVVRDPEQSSNLYEVFADPEGKDKLSGSTFCLDEDGTDAKARIEQQTKSELGKLLVDSMDMAVLDELTEKTYTLEGELKKLAAVKEQNFQSVEKSLEEAGRILQLERKSVVLKMLKELQEYVPEDYYQLPPDEQKAYREACHKLSFAASLYEKSSLLDLNKVANGAGTTAVADAVALWPRFKEDARVIHLMSKIIEVESE